MSNSRAIGSQGLMLSHDVVSKPKNVLMIRLPILRRAISVRLLERLARSQVPKDLQVRLTNSTSSPSHYIAAGRAASSCSPLRPWEQCSRSCPDVPRQSHSGEVVRQYHWVPDRARSDLADLGTSVGGDMLIARIEEVVARHELCCI